MNGFRHRALPEAAALAGYSALIADHDLRVPLPPRLAGIRPKVRKLETDDWLLLTPDHAPTDDLAGHLGFALRWEGVDLAVLNALFAAIPATDVERIVRATPTGTHSRRVWYLYEWLTGRTLDVPTPARVRLAPVLDDQVQFESGPGIKSPRHRVLDNLPGARDFCPLVRRTPALTAFAGRGLDDAARGVVGRTHPDLVTRAAAFLLLSDSRASFAIEKETPSRERAARWGHAIAQAGRHELTLAELERLQRLVIGDDRFVELGLRTEDGFVGMHDRVTQEPIPDHVDARPQDLPSLVDGMLEFARRSSASGDAVVMAAALAFGFVYVHPFGDGNGRIHRWLVHHVLARRGYSPPGVVFPVSSAILRRLEDYRRVLESYSRPLLALIDWRPSATGNVEVLNDTSAFYRYFDATAHAEFLYSCVAETVERDLPDEVAFLESFDAFSRRVKEAVEMPDRTVHLLHRFLEQGGGRLSRRARDREFASLTDDEIAGIEALHAESFGAARSDG